VRGRFAPTPSGYLHIGNALTALLAWLQVRSRDGQFILRIENLDAPRFRPSYLPVMLEDLYWLGIDWDEGPDVGGSDPPYEQRYRTEGYRAAYASLEAKGLVYPCFCSRKELHSMGIAPHGLVAEGPIYDGRCRFLSSEERQLRAQEKTPAWRFAVPDDGVEFTDAVAGHQVFPPGWGGDFIVYRADGVFSYQLAVVVDDAAMGVTHVLRGDDLLDSTPRQIYLYRQLGLEVPRFAHVPLVYGPGGMRFSKRDGSVTVRGLRQSGIRPEALVGYLAWLAGLVDRPEAVEARDLIGAFHMEHIRREPVTLNATWRDRLKRL